jgi:UDP-glucose:(heptosyl)LPS alpha-1,3-glucosyltransferase
MTGSSPLKIALAVFRLTPAGGLEQHALRLAAELLRRGHAVTLVTTGAPAEAPAGAEVLALKLRGRTNHGRLAAFAEDAACVAGRFDRSVAFHAIPGFDWLFVADPSRARPGPLRGLMPRYRTYAALEARAFAPSAGARVLCLSGAQRDAFARHHGAPAERLLLLPPTVDRLRADPAAADPAFRAAARARFAPDAAGPVWLWMGLQPLTKGLDRALRALAAAPAATLLVSGLPPASRAARPMRALARRLGVERRVAWLGFLADDEVPAALAAADLLAHPSRADVTGTVILEAMANGLPVITTAVCGYGEHVVRAGAGVVLDEPFRQADLDAALAAAAPERRALWSAAALAYTGAGDLFSGLARAAELIEAPEPSS